MNTLITLKLKIRISNHKNEIPGEMAISSES
jgi:hypothetical protein